MDNMNKYARFTNCPQKYNAWNGIFVQKSKLQTKQKNKEYEQARIDHFGKPTEIKEDKKKEEVDTITSNNWNMSQNEAQNIIENNTQVKIDKWSIDWDQKETRLEGLQKELKKIREKISELENNNWGQRFIDKYKELENATIDLINQIKSPTAPDTKIKDSMEIKSLQKSLSSIRHCIDINHKLKTWDMYYLNMLEATEEKIIKELQNMWIVVTLHRKIID